MDFKHQIGSSLQLATLRADALLLVVTPDLLESAGSRQVQLALDPVLKRLIADAVKAGDFALKSGRTLYLHHPEGVVAARVVVTVAVNQSAKAYKAALAHGLTLLKSGGASQLLIGGTVPLLQEHAFAAVVAAGDAHYVYRHSKPSAPTSPKWTRLTVLCLKDEVKDVTSGLALGQAVASGMRLAKECANRPGNLCTPSHLASEAKALAKQYV